MDFHFNFTKDTVCSDWVLHYYKSECNTLL